MGRIKSAMVKRIAKKAIVDAPETFNKEFENNKKVLGDLVKNKRTRNAIAGYITKLRKR